MMAYVGDTRSRKLIAKLRDYDVGQVVQRGRLHYEIHLRPWFYDNGAFEDWKAERPFDSGQVLADIATIDEMDDKPNFMVLPDEVAGGKRSLHMSMSWLERVPRDNWYLAVQDGIEPADVPWGEGFRGIFIGGTVWSGLYLRYRSIWPGYASHAIVDVAVFGIGWWVIFG